MLIPQELLRIQLSLFKNPPGVERFENYIQVMTGGKGDIEIPLGLFNPMAKTHIKSHLEQMISLGFEDTLRDALARANQDLKVTEDIEVGWVLADDLAGGWTCRETIEIDRATNLSAELKRGMLAIVWWASDTPSVSGARAQVDMQVFRAMRLAGGFIPKTIDDYIGFEKDAMEYAGVKYPPTHKIDHQKLEKYLDSTELGTLVAVMYGDAAAKKLGYHVLGFPQNAGRIVASERLGN